MLVLLGISSFFTFVVSLVLGVRLLRLANRTRQLPELAVGSSFIIAGVIGFVLMLVANANAYDLDDPFSRACYVGGYGSITVGVILNYLFIRQVFRPDARWALALFSVAAVLLLLTISPPPQGAISTGRMAQYWLGNVVRMGAGVWGATEALLYFAQMKKRQRIGLAQPSVTNRFLLWAIASLATAGIFLATSFIPIGQAVESTPVTPDPSLMVLVSVLTTATGLAQWLAFLPPKAYLRWIERRAGGQES